MSNTKKQIGIEAGRVSVFWLNMGYYSPETFDTLEAARGYVSSKGFEARFELDGVMLGAWTVFGGYRSF